MKPVSLLPAQGNLRILMVCLGNICRSPTAEGVLRSLAAREAPELELEVDSAGTADYHIGEPPDPRTCAAAARRGYDLSGLRARCVTLQDFDHFDLIIALDEANLRALRGKAPPRRRERVHLLLEYAPETGRREVPDPYYGDAAGFEQVIDLCEAGVRGLLLAIRTSRRDAVLGD